MRSIPHEPNRLRAPGKTLIVVAEPHGYTHAIARAIALRMRNAGHRVDVSDGASGINPPPDEYDAVILGAEASRQRDRRIIGDYISSHRIGLQDRPTGLFILCNSDDPSRLIDAFETGVGWRARFAAAFSYGAIGRTSGIIRKILLGALRMLDGSVADRGVKELTALADAMANELAKPRT